MTKHIYKNIYLIKVPLPNNPLRAVNSYVIKDSTGEKNLIIDTGFKHEVCLAALMNGIKDLDLDLGNTDVFFTHFHSDHFGLADEMAAAGCTCFSNRLDLEYKLYVRNNNLQWYNIGNKYFLAGIGLAELESMQNEIDTIRYEPVEYAIYPTESDTVLNYGGIDLECITTPGHSPGHMCLYNRRDKIMFTGDHVLFDISPNISPYTVLPDGLGHYLQSLKMISGYAVDLALPGHGNPGNIPIGMRTGQLLAHHESRLNEILSVLRSGSRGMTAAEIASNITWHVRRASSWNKFPPNQKWFALGETITHMEHLLKHKTVTRSYNDKGQYLYFTKGRASA